MIGIISYFNGDLGIWKYRSSVLKASIKDLQTLKHPIKIIAQCWTDEIYDEFKDLEFVEVLRYNEPLFPYGARNEFLKLFYGSQDEYGLFMDDDTHIKNYYNFYELLGMFLNNNPSIRHIDVCKGLFIGRNGYKEQNLKIKEIVERNFTFLTGMSYFSSCVLILKNLKKHFGKELYFNKYPTGEDLVFLNGLKMLGLNVLQCQQFFWSGDSYDHSVLKGMRPEDKKAITAKDNENLQYHRELNGFKNQREIEARLPKFNPNVPRLTPYTFSQRELDFRPRPRKSKTSQS